MNDEVRRLLFIIWIANKELGEEVFSPLGLVVLADNLGQMRAIAHALELPLTGEGDFYYDQTPPSGAPGIA